DNDAADPEAVSTSEATHRSPVPNLANLFSEEPDAGNLHVRICGGPAKSRPTRHHRPDAGVPRCARVVVLGSVGVHRPPRASTMHAVPNSTTTRAVSLSKPLPPTRRAPAASTQRALGITTRNSAPRPLGPSATSMDPPAVATRWRQTASPRPVPTPAALV